MDRDEVSLTVFTHGLKGWIDGCRCPKCSFHGDRAYEIINLRKRGQTYRQIANQYGLTGERVRKVVTLLVPHTSGRVASNAAWHEAHAINAQPACRICGSIPTTLRYRRGRWLTCSPKCSEWGRAAQLIIDQERWRRHQESQLRSRGGEEYRERKDRHVRPDSAGWRFIGQALINDWPCVAEIPKDLLDCYYGRHRHRTSRVVRMML